VIRKIAFMIGPGPLFAVIVVLYVGAVFEALALSGRGDVIIGLFIAGLIVVSRVSSLFAAMPERARTGRTKTGGPQMTSRGADRVDRSLDRWNAIHFCRAGKRWFTKHRASCLQW
jgi:hypothetical protein